MSAARPNETCEQEHRTAVRAAMAAYANDQSDARFDRFESAVRAYIAALHVSPDGPVAEQRFIADEADDGTFLLLDTLTVPATVRTDIMRAITAEAGERGYRSGEMVADHYAFAAAALNVALSAAFVRACWFCARVNHGRRFCMCGAHLGAVKP